MGRRIKRVVAVTAAVVIVLLGISVAANWNMVQYVFLGGKKVYETNAPSLPANIARPAILVFSKTNGFRHEDAIPAANTMLGQFAKDNSWGYFQTENGATFRPDILARFDAVIFNNVSGDVFNAEQRAALKTFIEQGGGFVGIHGSGGDGHYDWKWYGDELIGAQFSGHPMFPQFQKALIRIEDKSHPATKGLPAVWERSDEWYFFTKSPRRPGYNILLTLDEKSFDNHKMFGKTLSMGADHPIAWSHCVGKGRALYSALGHRAEAYSEPHHRAMLLNAIRWATRQEGGGCGTTEAK